MTLAELRAQLANANVSAFLRVIRARESSQDDSAYTVLNGGSHFFAFAEHPYKGQRTPPGKAAGAYQFIASTWADVEQQYGMPDFSPASQDAGAVARLIYRKALDDVIAGRFEAAVAKCRLEWTSLPGAAESSGSWTMDKARAVFLQYGGTLEGQAIQHAPRPTGPAPLPASAGQPIQREGTRMGIALPLLAQLIPQVLGLFSQRAQAAIAEKTGADPQVAADFMQSMIAQVGHAVSVPVVDNATATQAVAAVIASPEPAKVQALESQALATLDALLKAGDTMLAWDQAKWAAELEGRKASSDIAIAERKAGLWDMTRTVVWFAACTLSVLVFALLGALIFQAVSGTRTIDSGLLGLAGPIFMAAVAAWAAVINFRFDGTKEGAEQSKALLTKIKEA